MYLIYSFMLEEVNQVLIFSLTRRLTICQLARHCKLETLSGKKMKFGVIFVILLLSTLGWAKYFNSLFEGDIAVRNEVLGDNANQDAFIRHSSKTWDYNYVPYYIDGNSIR